jgi:thioredoxin-like negative regulator of GroEL
LSPLSYFYRKAAEYYGNVLDLSPEDFDIKLKYADCLNELNLNKKAEKMFYEPCLAH